MLSNYLNGCKANNENREQKFMPYATVNKILAEAGISAAGAHGMATGMIVSDSETTAGRWLSELLCDNAAGEINEADEQVLYHLFAETRRLLLDEAFGFGLLLPDDDMPLKDQAAAVKEWCQGFLLGVGSTVSAQAINPQIKEILKDFTEFTKLDSEAEGEEDEAALVEIIEYVRAAVLMLQDGFNDSSQGDGFETD